MSFKIAGKDVGHIGFGMISICSPWKNVSTEDAIGTLKAALNAGANFWDAGEHYGTPEYNSLHILKAYFTKYPEDVDKVVISVKSCFAWQTGLPTVDAAGVDASVERCLGILDGKCQIDVFQPSRLDPNIPVEETVGAIAKHVKAGRIGGVGLSECSAASIRKAAAVTTISACELELSLFETTILRNGVAEACKEFGIPIIAYSPLNRGFLTGQIKTHDDFPKNDPRLMFPRFQPDVFDENIKLVHGVEAIAKRKGYSTIQTALAWVSAQTDTIGVPVMPIPGTSTAARVEENMKVVTLSKEELEEIDDVLQRVEVKGGRYPEKFAHLEFV